MPLAYLLIVALQIACVVHVVRTGRDRIWIYVLILLPGADRSHSLLAVALSVWAALAGVLALAWGARGDEIGVRATSALAVPAIALGVYITGGTTSPLLPVVFLAVALTAYFGTPRAAMIRLAGAIVVSASPFLYSTADAQIAYVDTPGVQDGRGPLRRYMRDAALAAASDADVVLMLVDATDRRGRMPD